MTEFLISAIVSFFIVTATRSYFEALFLQKLNKKIAFWIWALIYLVTGPLAESITIPAQLISAVIYIFIATVLCKGDLWKKGIALIVIYVVNMLAEGAAFYIVNVESHPELYLHTGIVSKVAYMVFMAFAVFIGKRICKNVSISIPDRIMLVILPIISMGTGMYIFITQNATGGIKAIVCVVLLLVNIYVFMEFMKALKIQEEWEHKDKVLAEKNQEIIEKEKTLTDKDQQIAEKEKALQDWKDQNLPDLFIFTSRKGEKIVDKKDIMCVFAKKNEVTIIRKDDRDTYNDSIYNVYEELNRRQERFILLNRNVILNFDFITNKTAKGFQLGSIEFNIHKKNKEQVLEQYERIKNDKEKR